MAFKGRNPNGQRKAMFSRLKSSSYKYKITATAFNRKTGKPIATNSENINIKTNPIFRGDKTKEDIKKSYTRFWNTPNSPEIVKVKKIEKRQ